MTNNNSSNANNNNKGTKKYKITIGVMAVIIMLLGSISTVLLSERHSNAATFDAEITETEFGPVWAEQILDGSGRYILHIEHRDGVVADYLACELSYDMTFGEGWIVGAEMNDETTEVIYGNPGDTIYVRFQNEEGDYMIYPIILPGETAEVREIVEVEVPVATETATRTNTKSATPATTETQDTTKATKTQENTKTTTTTKDNTSETNRKVVNEEIINRKVVEEEIVNPVTEIGYVYVSYVDENGSKLASTLEISGSIGVSYSTEQKAFEGYTFASVEGNTNGKIAKNTQYVVYNYEKTEKEVDEPEVVEKGFVYVSYVDENGSKLASTLEISGNIGISYSTEQKVFEGYEFVSVDGATSGTIQAKVSYVTYNYAKIQEDEEPETPVVEMGKVTVSYVDQNGNKLIDDVVTEGEIGSNYVAEEKAFDGYELVSVNGEANGVIARETTVVFVYAAVVEEEHVHNYFVIEAAEAKCLTDGYVTYGCECGETYTEVVPAHGHSFKTYAVTEEFIEEHCMECGYVNMIYADVIENEDETETVVANNETLVTNNEVVVVNEETVVDEEVVVDAEVLVNETIVDAEEIVDTQ